MDTIYLTTPNLRTDTTAKIVPLTALANQHKRRGPRTYVRNSLIYEKTDTIYLATPNYGE